MQAPGSGSGSQLPSSWQTKAAPSLSTALGLQTAVALSGKKAAGTWPQSSSTLWHPSDRPLHLLTLPLRLLTHPAEGLVVGGGPEVAVPAADVTEAGDGAGVADGRHHGAFVDFLQPPEAPREFAEDAFGGQVEVEEGEEKVGKEMGQFRKQWSHLFAGSIV